MRGRPPCPPVSWERQTEVINAGAFGNDRCESVFFHAQEGFLDNRSFLSGVKVEKLLLRNPRVLSDHLKNTADEYLHPLHASALGPDNAARRALADMPFLQRGAFDEAILSSSLRRSDAFEGAGPLTAISSLAGKKVNYPNGEA